MTNKIIGIIGIIIMVVEIKAIIFLTWAWFDAKKKREDQEDGK